MTIASIDDFRSAARRRLPRFLFEYIDGGSYREETMGRNVADMRRVTLRQRVLSADVSEVRLSTRLLGQKAALPVVLGPVGLAGMYARRGEAQAARAADAARVPFCLSTVSVCALEEVKAAAATAPWLQLYVMRDRAVLSDLLERAAACGVGTLVFTVDMPVPGARYRDQKSGMSGPMAAARRVGQAALHPRWAWDVGLRGRPHSLGNLASSLGPDSGMNDFIGWMAANFDASIRWSDLAAVRERWPGKLVVKGILDPQDARDAASAGVDAVVVSNHGGRQLDGVQSSIAALPGVVDALQGKVEVLLDSGVRSGLDVVRSLALGADGVLLGRTWAYALAADGEAGVARLLAIVEAEMRVAMALCGCSDVATLCRDHLVPDR